ncbi:hypothetical protein PIB30_011377 [Stylosanthes scabra]|uniref:Uncharacterized protein n=1 Tax=Stylosanthes scabra TaxID=79078 RepID=A0ABU6Y3W1_9FABA|nr:hypothetical protein [Stylosanthes scabra]
MPPPLMAAVLPWDREDERRTDGDQNRWTVPAPSCELARRDGSHTESAVARSAQLDTAAMMESEWVLTNATFPLYRAEVVFEVGICSAGGWWDAVVVLGRD